jgi:hypothetical protein
MSIDAWRLTIKTALIVAGIAILIGVSWAYNTFSTYGQRGEICQQEALAHGGDAEFYHLCKETARRMD